MKHISLNRLRQVIYDAECTACRNNLSSLNTPIYISYNDRDRIPVSQIAQCFGEDGFSVVIEGRIPYNRIDKEWLELNDFYNVDSKPHEWTHDLPNHEGRRINIVTTPKSDCMVTITEDDRCILTAWIENVRQLENLCNVYRMQYNFKYKED